MKNAFLVAVTQISAERHLPQEVVLEAIEQALVLAYKRNFGAAQTVDVRLDPNTGKARVFVEKEIVEDVKDERSQISLDDARNVDPEAELGGAARIEMFPRNFGRIAVQTAKQVIQQRIREAERDTLYADWSDRLGELVLGTVRNLDSAGNVILSLGRAEALMPRSEQIPTERYSRGSKLRTYIYEVEKTSRGPRIRVSRSHRVLLRRLLESEVPEIFNGTVELKAIAREPGSRSKVAVVATQPGVDPVGSCVGMRGVRIQSIVNELNGEKIDVVAWAPEEPAFVANALSPARVEHVWLEPETRTATVVVPDGQLSLAIGKEGQNARLAAKLTGWRIDIKSLSEAADEAERRAKEAAEAAEREAEMAAKREAAKALLEEAEIALSQEEDQAEILPEEAPEAVVEAAVEAEPITAEAAQAEQVAEAEELPAAEAAPEEPIEAEQEAETVTVEAAVPGDMLPDEEPVAGLEAEPESEPESEPEAAVEDAEQLEYGEAEAEVWEEDEEEDEDAELGDDTDKRKKDRRRHQYVYDEDSESVVRRVKRKESRQIGDWDVDAEW